MLTIFLGIFLILHGVVFYLYAGHCARWFELKSGMTWPDGPWTFSKFPGEKATRTIGLISCLLSGTGFILGGIALLFSADWWSQIIIPVIVFSTIVIILLWDGSLQKITDQGLMGLIINLLLLVFLIL